MFLYGLNCVALFIGYCALAGAALLLVAAVVGYLSDKRRKK